MRITRDTLLKIARESAQARVQRNRGIVCIYLTGSLLGDDPLLGGTTDIDLVFVHDSEPLDAREIVRLTDDVHLDIAHFAQAVFHQPRHLRVHPWIGPYLCANPIILHDSHHWFEFTQASVCAQFNQPEYVYARASAFAQQARAAWMGLHAGGLSGDDPAVMLRYLDALESGANAIASFSGAPLPERRLFLHLPARAAAIDRPGLAAGLEDLVLAADISPEEWSTLEPAWEAALGLASRLENAPARLRPPRPGYYTRAAAALREQSPVSALWLVLRSWTLALTALDENTPQRESWLALTRAAGLSGDPFGDRLAGLDSFLDSIEEALDAWASEYGIEPNI